MVLFELDSSAILVEAMKNRMAREMIHAYTYNLSRTQKSSNQNLLYQEMSTRSRSNLVLPVPINFYS